MSTDDFYIGYDTPVPPGARAKVRFVVGAALLATVTLAAVAVYSQQPFADSTFAYGVFSEHTGLIRFEPHPVLDSGQRRDLLVAPGKHGADELLRAFEGRVVTLAAQEIRRGDLRMLEVWPGSVAVRPDGASIDGSSPLTSLGEQVVTGEILDAKCYLGVMNPGEGTVHRDCATVCLRGGIPPLVAVRTAGKKTTIYELSGKDGEAVGVRYASVAGRPVRISGEVFRRAADGAWLIRAHRVERAGLAR